MLVQEDTNCYVEFKELTSRETIEEEVIHFVKKNGGSLDNLSAVTLELKINTADLISKTMVTAVCQVSYEASVVLRSTEIQSD